MSTLTTLLVIVGSVCLLIVLLGFFGLIMLSAIGKMSSTFVDSDVGVGAGVGVADSDSSDLSDADAEDEEFTLETLMNQQSDAYVLAFSLHEFLKALMIAGFTRDEAYGFIQNMLYAKIVSQYE